MIDNAIGLCTISFNSNYRDLSQGTFRLRKLNRGEKGQFITLLYNKEVKNKINKPEINSKFIILMTYLNSISNEKYVQKRFTEQSFKALVRNIDSIFYIDNNVEELYKKLKGQKRNKNIDILYSLYKEYDTTNTNTNTDIQISVQTNINLNININQNINTNLVTNESYLNKYKKPFKQFDLLRLLNNITENIDKSDDKIVFENIPTEKITNTISITYIVPKEGFNEDNTTWMLIKRKEIYIYIITDYLTKYKIISIYNDPIINFAFNGFIIKKDILDIDKEAFYIYYHIKFNIIAQKRPTQWEIWKLTMKFAKKDINEKIRNLLFGPGSNLQFYASLIPDVLLLDNVNIHSESAVEIIAANIKEKYYKSSEEYLEEYIFNDLAKEWIEFYNNKIKNKKYLQLIQYQEEQYPN
jgi:hypothetical protein